MRSAILGITITTKLPKKQQRMKLIIQAVHIYRSTAAKSLLFRPPSGRLNNGLVDYAKKKNYVVVLWSIAPKDFL